MKMCVYRIVLLFMSCLYFEAIQQFNDITCMLM